jgi:tetratricopeptide (TPR) repeat protein
MEDILNDALPNRKKDNVPDLGDTNSIKEAIRSEQLDFGEVELSELRRREIEEDAGWDVSRGVKNDDEVDGIGVDAPVIVPAAVFDLNAQAQFCFLKEEYNDALDYLEQSLSLIKSTLGSHHNEAATVMVSMSQIHERLKNFEEAERLLADAIVIRKQVDGPVHTSVAVAINKLAHVQTCQKKFEEALKSSKTASRIIQAALAQNEQELKYHHAHQSTL